MLKKIKIDDKELEILYNWKFDNSIESDTYLAKYQNKYKVIKIFKEQSVIDNKIKKILLLKERLKNQNNVVTADAFITDDKKIIGYMMPYVKGTNFYYEGSMNKKQKILYLKELSKLIKRLHTLNIVLMDFYSNVITDKDGKITLIDSDNFAIDKLDVDQKNTFLYEYERHVKTFDKNFDCYMLNIYTICLLKNYATPYIYSIFKSSPLKFNFKDKEINEIFNNTMNLGKTYKEELIIDKINSVKDLKKIKVKF